MNFQTANSGTFIIEEGKSLYIERTQTTSIPSQLLGIGGSVQIRAANSLFHEISLTKLSVVKASEEIRITTLDSLGDILSYPYRGYDYRATALGLRYEFGKYFGNTKAKVRFGLSAGLEPSMYFYKMTPEGSVDYPVSGSLLTFELSLNPILCFNLSKKVSLEFKAIPNTLLGDFGGLSVKDPSLTERQQKNIAKREYKSPDINLSFSVLLRYVIKEPKKK